MKTFKKIMYVVDPTTDTQRALGRVADGAAHLGADLHLYVCVSPPTQAGGDKEAQRKAETARYQSMLDLLAETAREKGCTVTTEVNIAENWRTAIAPAAQRWGAEMIVKALHPHTAMQRRLGKTADWTLMRTAECPILFVKEDNPNTPENLVAAVDLAEKNPQHLWLMQEVIRHSRGICEVSGAQLHVANACPTMENTVDVTELARFAEVDRRHAHVGQGSPEEVLERVAAKLDGPVVVIGSSHKRSFVGKVLGNSAERILDKMEKDVLVILAPHEAQQEAA